MLPMFSLAIMIDNSLPIPLQYSIKKRVDEKTKDIREERRREDRWKRELAYAEFPVIMSALPYQVTFSKAE